MTKFKQKEFGWFLPLLTVGSTGATMVQASSQAKESEEQAEKTQELMRAQNKKLEKIAKAAKTNPNAASQAAQVLEQSQYSAIPIGAMRNIVKGKQALQAIGTAGKEAFGKGLARNVAGGVGMGVATYGAGKLIQRDMKKEGMDVDENGNLYQKSYAMPVLSTVTNAVKKWAEKNPKTSLAAGGIGTGVGFVGAPTLLGYKADKAQMKDQIEATQKQFAVLPMSFLRGIVRGKQAVQGAVSAAKPVISNAAAKGEAYWKAGKEAATQKKDALVKGIQEKEIVKNPGKTLLGFGSTMTSFGVMGRESVGKFATNLMNSKSEWAQKLGKGMLSKDAAGNLIQGEGKYAGQFLANKKAMAGAIGAGALATKATWDAGEKITNKIGHKVDPDAYKYQDAKNQQV